MPVKLETIIPLNVPRKPPRASEYVLPRPAAINLFLGRNGSNELMPKNRPALSIIPKIRPLTIPTPILFTVGTGSKLMNSERVSSGFLFFSD